MSDLDAFAERTGVALSQDDLQRIAACWDGYMDAVKGIYEVKLGATDEVAGRFDPEGAEGSA